MRRTDRFVHRATRSATVAAVICLSFLAGALRAAETQANAIAGASLPLQLSPNSILKGLPLQIGDLSVVSESEAGTIGNGAAVDRNYLARCIQAGPDWLRWSDDGVSVELKSPWSPMAMTQGMTPPKDQVVAVYCDDETILVGGYVRRATEENAPRQAWIFSVHRKADGTVSGPARTFFARSYTANMMTGQAQYTLNELRAIDPASRRMLFAGTAQDGSAVLLAAPYTVILTGGTR